MAGSACSKARSFLIQNTCHYASSYRSRTPSAPWLPPELLRRHVRSAATRRLGCISTTSARSRTCPGMACRCAEKCICADSFVTSPHVADGPLRAAAWRVEPYARRTVQLTQALTVPGFALGGEAGARLARRLAGVKSSISPDTLLRLIRQQMPAAAPTPRVLGVDDFAFHRGIHCGTILVDLERPRVVDLLPDREARIFAAWLRAHPGIAVISRDRSSAYSEATQQAAPGAMQVAIRFHVWGWRWTGCLPASTASSLRSLAKSTKPDKSRPRARLNPPHSHARRPRVTSGGQISRSAPPSTIYPDRRSPAARPLASGHCSTGWGLPHHCPTVPAHAVVARSSRPCEADAGTPVIRSRRISGLGGKPESTTVRCCWRNCGHRASLDAIHPTTISHGLAHWATSPWSPTDRCGWPIHSCAALIKTCNTEIIELGSKEL